MNIKGLLHQGAEILSNKAGALLDCEVLLAYVLGMERNYLVAHNDEEIDAGLTELFFQYLRRVKEGEPVAYIIGEKEFYGLNFFVDERVLIPRPETEGLVDRVLAYLRNREEENVGFRIVDVGTGSGNISVSVAKSFESGESEIREIIAVDCDYAAVDVAMINVLQHGFEEKIRVLQSDLLDFAGKGEKFDVIVANLPYIGRERNKFVSVEAEKYEPHVALFGGEGGLELYKKMFQQIVEKEIVFDVLIGEFGFEQREEMKELLNKYFEQNWVIDKDYAGIDRVFIIKNPSYVS